MQQRLREEMEKGEKMLEEEFNKLRVLPFNYKPFTEEGRIIIMSMKKLSYVFQYTDETLAYSIHNLRSLYNEVAKRLNITYNQLVSMLLSEITTSLEKNSLVISKEELNTRYHDHVLFINQGKSTIFTGKNCEEYIKANTPKIDTKIKELKGVVANKGGIIKGRVKIINHADEISTFQKGDILVTPMTNPSFVPAMRKASAIITNDGGLLCHAAIVSRELRVPCVINTKIATKVFKDGDLIEVDAEKGTVRKL